MCSKCTTKKVYSSKALYSYYYNYQGLASVVSHRAYENDWKYLREVLKEAHGNFFNGDISPAIIAHIFDGRTSVMGFNSKKTHPLQKKFAANEHKIYLHAEIDALVRAARKNINWKTARIGVYRWLKDGTPALSFPCDGCIAAIKDAGIRDLFFFGEDGRQYQIDLGRLE